MERYVIRNYPEFKEIAKRLDRRYLAIDTETTSLSYKDMELVGFSLCDGSIALYFDGNDDCVIRELQNVINDCNILIAHNITFDLKVLRKVGIKVPERVELFCTKVAAHLLDENREKGLKYLAKSLLGKEVVEYKDAVKDKETFEQYAINDAVWTFELARLFTPHLKSQGLSSLFRKIEMPFQKCIVDMETRGILLDTERMSKIKEELEETIKDRTIKMLEILEEPYDVQYDLCGTYFINTKINFGSPKQLSNILFEKLGLDIVERTPTGAPSVGRKTIDKYFKKNKFVGYLYDFKLATKLLNAFFEPIPGFADENDVIYPNFNDTGTKTGRLSSSNPNFQQLPKPNKHMPIKTRECFVARPGYKMIACDYSGQELRVLAHISGEPVMIETFEKGKDMHLSTANDFFDLGIPEEELYSTHPRCKEHKEMNKDARNKAKVINFGMAYGKGAYGFSQDFGITEEEAQKILDKYFAALPRVKQAIDECHSKVRTDGFVQSLTGRRRRFEKVKRDDWEGYPSKAYRQSFNFLIQGYSADMIRLAAIETRRLSRENPSWDLRMLMTVHDEIVYEVREQYAAQAARRIKEEFERVVKLKVPVKADVEIGDNYGDVK